MPLNSRQTAETDDSPSTDRRLKRRVIADGASLYGSNCDRSPSEIERRLDFVHAIGARYVSLNERENVVAVLTDLHDVNELVTAVEEAPR
jgi:hypothetical protein